MPRGRKKKKVSLRTIPRTHVFLFITILFFTACVSSGMTYLFFLPQLDKKAMSEVPEDRYTEHSYPTTVFPTNQLSSQVIFHGSREKKQIALTFDAEMTSSMRANYLSGKVKSSYDPQIVDVLNKTQTKATFFLTGMWIELYPNETKSFSQNPLLELGSHSFADTSYSGTCYGLSQIKDTQDLEEVETTQKLLRDVAGIENTIFRFPGGCYSEKNLAVVISQARLKVVHWDVVGNDGFTSNTQAIESNVINNVQNGSIIVLHMNGAPTAPKTAEALPNILSALKAKGYEFVKVSELLGV